MPWLPELFSAPALERLEEERRQKLEPVPYFAGLMAGEPGALVESFAGEPELHHPVRGRIKGARAFEAFVADTNVWIAERNISIEDVEHVVLERRGFEEVVLHLDGDSGRVELPVALVADRLPGGRIEELRMYYGASHRPPLLQPDPELQIPDVVAEYQRSGTPPQNCALVDDGRACALEYNVMRGGIPRAGAAVYVRDASGKLAAVRVYD